ACDYYDEFEKNKIIIPAIVKNASYAFDERKFYSNDKTSIIPTNDKYLLGLINSKPADYFLKSIASTKQGGYFEYKPMYVSKLPIKLIDLENKGLQTLHDEIVKLVNTMLQLQQQKQQATLANQIEQADQRIIHTDNAINQKVYQLYDLTEEEIKIIEEA
ncbi:MAG TPA: TaqI-like C-terminal specificity domain-containing protein, partial [Chitinophagaceae bacterium]|nr:TaqI-like C-terminal specificity domain-containing protein [Chitinophagaceae bacterium]